MFPLGTLRALPPVVNPNLIVIKIFKASVATLFQKLIVCPKINKKSREKIRKNWGKNLGQNQENIEVKTGKKWRKTEGENPQNIGEKSGKKLEKTTKINLKIVKILCDIF